MRTSFLPALVIAIVLSVPPTSLAQVSETTSAGESGLSPVVNFAPRDYGAAPQNWAAVVDDRGLLYVANAGGILEYDGVSWRLIPTRSGSSVLSLEYTSKQELFVGTEGDIGYLATNEVGERIFSSLKDRLPQNTPDFNQVWDIWSTPDGVYFHTYYLLLRWNDGSFETWPFERQQAIHRTFAVDGTFYATQVGRGLTRMQGDSLTLVPGGDRYAASAAMAMMSHPEGILIGEPDGLVLYDGENFVPFPTEAASFIRERVLFRGAALPDDRYALWTYEGGVAIIDASGRLLHVLDDETGLQTSKVYSVAADASSGLWLPMDYGISYVEEAAPFTLFDESVGLVGSVRGIARHNESLYVTTERGLFVLVQDEVGRPARFERVADVGGDNAAILSTEAGLLVTATDWLYVVRDGEARTVLALANRSLATSPDGRRVYVGGPVGLQPIEIDAFDQWQPVAERRMLQGGVSSMVTDTRGRLWAGSLNSGLLRFDYSTQYDPAIVPDTILQAGGRADVARLWGDVVVTTADGVFRYDSASNALVPHEQISAFIPQGTTAFIEEIDDEFAAIITARASEARVATIWRSPDGSVQWNGQPFPRLSETSRPAIFHDDDGTIWIGGDEALFRYSSFGVVEQARHPTAALIRGVFAGTDSLLYGGHGRDRLELSSDIRALRFRYATPSSVPSTLQYRSRLDGFEREWGPWTAETQRDYTNLPTGTLTFHVQTQDATGAVSEEATFAVYIRPPWYATGWARGFFALLSIGLIGLIAREGPAVVTRVWARLPYRRVVSHYRLDRVLGSGGAGQVWQARNLGRRPGEPRDVAVKLLHIETPGPEHADRNRLLREAKVVSSLDHPNIVRIYETGVWKETPFIAMELLHGETLRRRIQLRGAIPHIEALPILSGITDALAAVHDANVIHRDVKSENVMLVPDGDGVRAVLMDFGLARGTNLTTLTQLGQLLGTLGYAAPEQAMGHEADFRSDVFALGVVMYEAFTGRLPFDADNEIAMLHAIFSQEPQPVNALIPDVPEGLSDLVLQMLSKEPDERPATAGEVAKRLRRTS